jgi:hypothetical protein
VQSRFLGGAQATRLLQQCFAGVVQCLATLLELRGEPLPDGLGALLFAGELRAVGFQRNLGLACFGLAARRLLVERAGLRLALLGTLQRFFTAADRFRHGVLSLLETALCVCLPGSLLVELVGAQPKLLLALRETLRAFGHRRFEALQLRLPLGKLLALAGVMLITGLPSFSGRGQLLGTLLQLLLAADDGFPCRRDAAALGIKFVADDL